MDLMTLEELQEEVSGFNPSNKDIYLYFLKYFGNRKQANKRSNQEPLMYRFNLGEAFLSGEIGEQDKDTLLMDLWIFSYFFKVHGQFLDITASSLWACYTMGNTYDLKFPISCWEVCFKDNYQKIAYEVQKSLTPHNPFYASHGDAFHFWKRAFQLGIEKQKFYISTEKNTARYVSYQEIMCFVLGNLLAENGDEEVLNSILESNHKEISSRLNKLLEKQKKKSTTDKIDIMIEVFKERKERIEMWIKENPDDSEEKWIVFDSIGSLGI